MYEHVFTISYEFPRSIDMDGDLVNSGTGIKRCIRCRAIQLFFENGDSLYLRGESTCKVV